MSDQAPQQKSGLGPIVLAIVMLAVGFALGHIASDLGIIKGNGPKLPEAKQTDGTHQPRDRDGRDALEHGGSMPDDVAEEAEDTANEHEPELGQIDTPENVTEEDDDGSPE